MEASELQHAGVVYMEGENPIFHAREGDFAPFAIRVAKIEQATEIADFLGLPMTVVWRPVAGESSPDMRIHRKVLHSAIASRAWGLFQCGARGNAPAHWLAAEDELLGFFSREFIHARRKLTHTETRASEILNVPEDAMADRLAGLVRMLRDPDAHCRQAAAESLGHMGPENAQLGIPALITNMRLDSSSGVRAACTIALGRVGTGTPEVIDFLVRALESDVRSSAVVALGEMGAAASAAIPELTQALTDHDLKVRFEADEALDEIAESVILKKRKEHLQ